MITRSTKIQLFVFVAITLIGVSYVGAKYAQLDRMVIDRTYTVSADFGESGGIFTGAEVTYRGVAVGRVGDLSLTRGGVQVDMDIEESADPIPRDVVAVVANRSALGEQYVDLQPKRKGEPYLEDGSEIPRADTVTPISTTQLLTNLDKMVNSVGRENLRTVVSELGTAFRGTGRDLADLIDTQTSFIETADDHFDLTEQLIRDGRVVLQTQIDSKSAIETFATNLARFSDTLVEKDRVLRRVIDSGDTAAVELRRFIEDNEENLGVLIRNLMINGETTVVRLHGFEQFLMVFPYIVEGSYATTDKDPRTGLYQAYFGIALTEEPHYCKAGYDTPERPPHDLRELPFPADLQCTASIEETDARGAKHHPAPLTEAQAGVNRPVVWGKYDPRTGKVHVVDAPPEVTGERYWSAEGAQVFGKDSWQWLLLGPVMTDR